MDSSEFDKLPIGAVKKVAPSVVSVVISKRLSQVKANLPLPMAQDKHLFDGLSNSDPIKIGGGTGFVVHPDGLILTNKHVVFDPSSDYSVLLDGGQEHKAQILSIDPINDIAVLKIDKKDLPAIDLGDSSKVQIGQTVIAIGNALGMFSNSVSKGIISGLSRSISASLGNGGATEELRGVIQTDVAINQGNSGGPLVNLEGQAVGINTAVIFGAQNIGFAIPVNWAKEDLKDIIEHGRIIKPYLGLQFLMINKEIAKRYSLPVEYGALVMRGHLPNSMAVIPKSPADEAGVKENDIVLSVNNQELKDGKDLRDMLQELKVGDDIEMTILRGTKGMKVKTTLKERPMTKN